ncbi:MAG: hypothetical protein M1834_009054 [Cirrosporium novae-zelandiae]|nr:MAG: hypothetical protein M1834_009054 [Cirrosporium novae-zelandiae]
MADILSGHEISHPNLNLTPEEKRVYFQLFQAADTDNIGVVTGEVAIWQLADTENRGLLTPAGFAVVLRLIGHAQAGQTPSAELATKPGPLPKFNGIGPPQPSSPPPLQPQFSGAAPLQPQVSGGPIRVPPLTADKANQFAALFEQSGAQNGMLSGDMAKQIFEKAKLPNELLGRIWFLADTEQKGVLGVTQFIIAMHLITSFKSGALRVLPQTLPAGLYDAALRRGASSRAGSVSAPRPASAIPRQFSGAGPARTQSPMVTGSFPTPSPLSAQSTSNDWVVSPAQKIEFDRIFAGLDTDRKGFIDGEQAVSFFTAARLPEEVLAQIWDLADIHSEGRLNRDEFAVAMYLIRQQRGRKEGRGVLPTALPPNLVPPSMRRQDVAPTQPTAPAFNNAPASTQSKSATDDLFGLDAFSAPEPQIAQNTGMSATSNGPFGTPTSPRSIQGTHTSPPQSSSMFKPFIPSSAFGQGIITTQGTGMSDPGSSAYRPPQPTIEDDLLGDADPDTSSKLTQETAELANLSNQVGTLSQQMQDVQIQRSTVDQNMGQSSAQKKEFEMRLSQLRAAYEQEVKDLKVVELQLSTLRNDVVKLQQDIAMIEGTHQDVRNQHQQVFAALESERAEKANLQEKLRLMNAEIAQLKPEVEKASSQLRQQKGLNTISKKQLSTLEGERDKLSNEIEGMKKETEELAAENAGASHVQSPAPIMSPASSSVSQSTNPFFRTNTGQESNPMAAGPSSPPREGPSPDAFDNIFGPAFASTPSAGPPPVAFGNSHRPEDMTASMEMPGGSARSSSSTDMPTPSATPPPAMFRETSQPLEPPPPPQSRQVTPSPLPFREQPERSESVSSSVKASAPGSRFGAKDSRSQSPFTFVGSTTDGNDDNPIILPSDTEHVIAPESSREAPTEPSSSIPGAFPGETPQFSKETDPFSQNHESPQATDAKDDFDAAFAGFGTLGSSRTADAAHIDKLMTGSKQKDEFPPIQLLDEEDDSDSSSGAGFDDDFTAVSPPRNLEAEKEKVQRPPIAPAESNSSELPTADAQVSPPSYEPPATSSPEATNLSNQFPPEFTGLLPSREDPTASGPSSVPTVPFTNGTETVTQPALAPKGTESAPNGNGSKDDFNDDFDDAFSDLAEAKEEKIDDSELPTNQQDDLDDFNPVFDSPDVTNSTTVAPTTSTLQPDSAFADFESNIGGPAQTSQEAGSGDHDWDAIFAGLDDAKKEDPSASLGDDVFASGPSDPKPVDGAAAEEPAKLETPKEAPKLDRTLTTEHDDPILKRLTAMGYPRDDSVAALEKFDYNLDKVSA